MRLQITILSFAALATADLTFIIFNNCSSDIWPAITGNTSSVDPLPPGLSLGPGDHHITTAIQTPWSGRVWPRQYCQSNGMQCRVGDCGSPSCWGSSSSGTTLFEVTASTSGIWYDISLGMYR